MAKLGLVITQVRGVSYSPKDLHDSLNDESIILLRANNIKDGKINFDDVVYIDKKKVNKNQYLCRGDVLICTSSGSKELVGKAAFFSENTIATFGAFCKVIRPSIPCKEFIGHFFNSPFYRREISSLSSGANINNIRNEHIDNLEMNLPTENIQEAITRRLNFVNSLIESRQKQLSKLDQLVKSRFIEMFGDVYLNTMSWDEKDLESIADIVSGITKGRKVKNKKLKEVPYMAVSNVKDGYIDWSTVKKIDVTDEEISRYRLLKDDVLITEGGDPDKVGRGAIIKNPLENCIHQNHIFRVRLNKLIVLPVFFAEYLQHQKSKRYFLSCAKQTTGIASINMKQLKSLPVLLPPIKLQRQFSDFIQQVEKAKSSVKQSLEKLETLKKSLMQEYFG